MTSEDVITTPPLELEGLVRLSHHRWVIPLVAALGRERGGRFAALQHELAVARPTLERALGAADRLALVMSNPGYGHPLRPEYLLTPFGEAIAPACLEVVEAARGLHDQELAGRKWSLPSLAALRSGHRRFGDLRVALGTVTPRALAQALDDLVDAGWVDREVQDVRPPRPRYRVSGPALELSVAALVLAKVAR